MEFIIFFVFIVLAVQTELTDYPNPFTTIKYFELTQETNDSFLMIHIIIF